jgi:hypothetical protein
VGGDFSRRRGLMFIGLGVLALIVAIIVVAATAGVLAGRGGLYVVYIGESVVAYSNSSSSVVV